VNGQGLDRVLLGLEPHIDGPGFAFEVVERLTRPDNRLYGGAAAASVLAVVEAVTGRSAVWSTTQVVSAAQLGERLVVMPSVVQSGRTISQVQVQGTVGDRLVFTSVAAAAAWPRQVLDSAWRTMPREVPPPAKGEALRGLLPDGLANPGHFLACEQRLVSDDDDARAGKVLVWARLLPELAGGDSSTTTAAIAFLSDLVPFCVSRAAGVAGAGSSLDITLRFGERATSEWVLVEIEADLLASGIGHGAVRVWSEDGRLLAVGSQTARMFTYDEFIARLASP
jgi:acyl-CoA thioesterase II